MSKHIFCKLIFAHPEVGAGDWDLCEFQHEFVSYHEKKTFEYATAKVGVADDVKLAYLPQGLSAARQPDSSTLSTFSRDTQLQIVSIDRVRLTKS
jgi:hypothetical protein